MFLVNTKLGPSPIHGIGLFADQDINEGQLVYGVVPSIIPTLTFTEEEFSTMLGRDADFVLHYGYLYTKGDSELWCLNLSNIRFLNHSEDPNLCISPKIISGGYSVLPGDTMLVTTRFINAGDELTQNYAEFDRRWKNK